MRPIAKRSPRYRLVTLLLPLVLLGCSSNFEQLIAEGTPQFCYSTLADAECFEKPLPPHDDARFQGFYLRPREAGLTNAELLVLGRQHVGGEAEP